MSGEMRQTLAVVAKWVAIVVLAEYLAGMVVTWIVTFASSRRYRLEKPEEFARGMATFVCPWVQRRRLRTQHVLACLVAGIVWPTFFWYLWTERKGKRP